MASQAPAASPGPAPGREGRALPVRALVRELGLALLTLGFVVLLFVAYDLVGTNLSEQHSQSQLARSFRSAVAEQMHQRSGASAGRSPNRGTGKNGRQGPARKPSKPVRKPGGGASKPGGGASKPGSRASKPGGGVTGGPHPATTTTTTLPVAPPGGALDHLLIPAIGVDRYVVQGVSEADLQMGPGHYPGTPLAGHKGNVGIAGHRTTFGAPFFRLNELVPGDLIYLTDTSDSTWVYRVTHQWVVPPSDVGVLGPTNKAELTLTTCNPRFEATSRLVVRAVLTSELRPGTVSASLPKAGHAPGAPPSTAPLSRPATGAPTTTASDGTVPPSTAPSRAVPSRTAPSKAAPSKAAPSKAAPSRTVPAVTGPGGVAPAGVHPAAPGKGAASLAPAGGGWWATLGWGGLALALWAATRVGAARVSRARRDAQRGAPGWRRGRHMGLLVLVGGALVCLVPLWFTFENTVRLLPANF